MDKLLLILISFFILNFCFAGNYISSDSIYVDQEIKLATDQLVSDPLIALEKGYKCLQISKEIEFLNGEKSSLNLLGVLFSEFKLSNEAIKHFKELKKLDNTEYEKFEISNQIAKSYTNLSDFKQAISYYKENFEYAKRIKDTSLCSQQCLNIGTCYFKDGDFDNALQYFNTSLRYLESYDNSSLLALNYQMIGSVLFEKNNIALALEYYFKSLYLYQGISAIFGEASMCIEISKAYFENMQYDKAIEFSKYAYTIALESNLQDIHLEASALLSKSYFELKKYEEASKYAVEYQKVLSASSISKQKTDSDLTNLKAKILSKAYETELKNKYENKMAVVESKSNRSSLLLGGLGGLLILVLIGSIVYIIHSKNKCRNLIKQKSKLIEQKSFEIEKMESTRTKFLNIISHDLKNPFNALLGFSNLLLTEYDDFSDIEKKKFIRQIFEATDSITKLLNNLLEWAKTQSGSIKLRQEPINLSNILNNVLPLVKTHAKNKNIFIKSNIQPDSPAFADSNMVSTVLRNLITNAVKFTPENGEIAVETNYNGKFVEIAVKDNGIGISKEHLTKVFNGKNGKDSMPKINNNQGSGLGLILCKEFVLKNGGKIWVESEEGKGSAFRFTLPIRKLEAETV